MFKPRLPKQLHAPKQPGELEPGQLARQDQRYHPKAAHPRNLLTHESFNQALKSHIQSGLLSHKHPRQAVQQTGGIRAFFDNPQDDPLLSEQNLAISARDGTGWRRAISRGDGRGPTTR